MLFSIPSTLTASTTQYLTATLADGGTLGLIVMVIAIPLLFYVVKKVIGLFPKR